MLCEVTSQLEAGETLDHYRLDAEVARSSPARTATTCW